jgi:signal transduction histidine kinase
MPPSVNAAVAEPRPEPASSASNVVGLPVRHEYDAQLDHDFHLTVETADELTTAMGRVVGLIRRDYEALARRNEALEDFAALVAHELKTPLQAALVADDPSRPVEDALDLVEALLEAAGDEPDETAFASVAEILDQTVDDLGAGVEITSDLATSLPLPPGPLRVILRNLLSNAVAAGARHIHVAASRSPRSWQLLVDDDGVGLAVADRYAAGSGLGLSLCRRIAERFGGVLELTARPYGGTRATLEFAEAPK